MEIIIHVSFGRRFCMIRRAICKPVNRLFLAISAILCIGHLSAYAQARPPHLVFSTYLGGSIPCGPGVSPLTFAQNAASDAQGNTYVTGATQVYDLPVLNAWQPQAAADSVMSAFVAKYDPAGKLLWCTYLGGNAQSMGVGIALMPDGGVAVAGLTSSIAPKFPTMNAFQLDNNGQSDYFVSVFDAGGAMRYSTYLGGSGVEGTPNAVFSDDNSNGNNIAVDAHGLVYITGATSSAGGGGTKKFPVTQNALQPDLAGKTDAFLCIIDPGKSGQDSLVYSSFLGGTDDEKGHGIAVNADGSQITLGGYTNSSDFPSTDNAYRSTPPPPDYTSNGFITQFTSNKPGDPASHYALRYSTYLGADSRDARDDTYGIILDSNGLILATGRTQSSGFPMTNPPEPSIYNSAPYLKAGTSNDEPYLVKIDPSLNGKASLVYSTFLGGGAPTPGGGGSFCTGVAVAPDGTAYVAGETSSLGIEYTPSREPVEAPSLFPYTDDALFPALQGNYDAMLMRISTDGSTLAYSTFLGGKESERSYGLTSDPFGGIILTGLTFSPDFPLENAAQTWPGNAGCQNAFVAKFSSGGYVPGAPPAVTAAPAIGGGAATASFTAPMENGSPIQFYTVTSHPGGITGSGAASPITVSGLTNGTAYAFTVTATNGAGTGAASSASNKVTPSTVPAKPSVEKAVRGNGQTTIHFAAPTSIGGAPGNGGSPITSYTVISNPEGIAVTREGSNAGSITVTGLTYNIPYMFRVTAANANGSGAPSDPSAPVTPSAAVPGAPEAVTAMRDGNQSLSVSFTAPAANGSKITKYTVTSYPGGITGTGAASPIRMSGLTNGTAYSFRVTATNAFGTGPASARSRYVTPATLPFAPKIGNVIKGNGQATVHFAAPTAIGGVPGNGGSPITSYTVTSDPEGISVTRDGRSTSQITVTGLTGGKAYAFTVRAANAIGESASSYASNIVTPTAAIPGAPTEVTAIPGGGQATVSFTAPLENGSPIQFYTVFAYPSAIPFTGSTSSPITVTGLANGKAYTFRVTATNWIGTGAASAPSDKVTPSTVPGKPTNVQAVRGNGQATVSFTGPVAEDGVPGNGGSPITSYTVSLNGFISVTKAASPIIVTGLENGTEYTFDAWANNKNGNGAVAASNAVTPATLPGAPTITSATKGDKQASIYFTAPSIDGGSPIIKYTVTASPGGKTASGNLSPLGLTVTGLANGTAYTFTVKAANAVGTGPASAASGKVIPGATIVKTEMTPFFGAQGSAELTLEDSELDKITDSGSLKVKVILKGAVSNTTYWFFLKVDGGPSFVIGKTLSDEMGNGNFSVTETIGNLSNNLNHMFKVYVSSPDPDIQSDRVFGTIDFITLPF
jgi:hypothetical protein